MVIADLAINNVTDLAIYFAGCEDVDIHGIKMFMYIDGISPVYPEVCVYGKILPAKGIYFRYINGLTLDNVTVDTYRPDAREDFVMEHVKAK